MRLFDKDCDLLEQFDDCYDCYRYDICEKYFEKHPNEIYCPDDLKHETE